MSADEAETRAQERNYQRVDVALTSGMLPKQQKNMSVTLKTATVGSIKLVNADGTVTPDGLHYYDNVGVEPPSAFAYEQPLEWNKWVKALTARRSSSNAWEPTATGTQLSLASSISNTTKTNLWWSTL